MINFIVPLDFLPQRLESLEKMTSKQERNSLMVDDHKPTTDILKEITSLVPINEKEADVFLIKIRESSVQDQIEYLMTCSNCNTMNDFRVDTSECIDLKETKYKGQVFPVGLWSSLDTIINNTELDQISIIEYKELEQILEEQNERILKKVHTRFCRKCNEEMIIYVNPRSVYSKSTLATIYSDYVNISTFTNNGKLDIDSLYPFEREIYNSLIADKMKEGSPS